MIHLYEESRAVNFIETEQNAGCKGLGEGRLESSYLMDTDFGMKKKFSTWAVVMVA